MVLMTPKLEKIVWNGARTTGNPVYPHGGSSLCIILTGDTRHSPCELGAFSFPELRSSWPAPRIESSGGFQSVLVTDWSDGSTMKTLTGRNRKRMAEGILFSVCRTCNRYIISNNHLWIYLVKRQLGRNRTGLRRVLWFENFC